MTDETKEKIRQIQLKAWKKHGRKRKVRDRYAKKRANGEFITNIEQMASDEAYRDYQREYKHVYYAKNRSEWNRYCYLRKLVAKSLEELVALKNKHENSVLIAEAMGETPRVEKLNRLIVTIDEVISMRDLEVEMVPPVDGICLEDIDHD